jgi:hypothetical protein
LQFLNKYPTLLGIREHDLEELLLEEFDPHDIGDRKVAQNVAER